MKRKWIVVLTAPDRCVIAAHGMFRTMAEAEEYAADVPLRSHGELAGTAVELEPRWLQLVSVAPPP